MFRLILITVLFTLPSFAQPTGTVTDGPSSIRSFRPASSTNDDAIETYFNEAGSLAIEFYEHLTLLSNPWLGGREPGSNGSKIAGEYITWNLNQSGLTPAFNNNTSWYQPFVIEDSGSAPQVLDSFAAIGDIALVHERDFVVLGNSGSGSVTAPVTFVGYAIEEGEDNYTSFDDDTDLTGNIALMFRYEPLDEHGASQWSGRRFSPNSNIRDKMDAVVQRGAAGVILVNPPNCRDGRRGLELVRSSRFGSTVIPVLQLSHDIAELLISEGDLATLQAQADAGTVTTFDMDQTVTLRTEVETAGVTAQNIGGILQGTGELADEWVVIGSHYDHVGYGYTGSSYRGELHNGADDNASGSSVNIMLARIFSEYYADSTDDSLRSILFIFFDGEEVGLKGSAYFVKEPTITLEDVNAMINLDMVGNLSNNNISISGTGTAEEFDVFIPEMIEDSILTASLTPGGTGPSDHTNFYKNDIPVIFFFTGITDEYHTPQDQAFTTNPAGAAVITELTYEFTERLIKDEKLTFAENTGGSAGRTARMPSPVRLGVHPSYTSELESGILLSGVSEGTSAEDAGLQTDDILLAWNEVELTGGRKLMELLRESKPGDVVDFTVQRNEENISIKVTLKAP
jgi:hypothetical protein